MTTTPALCTVCSISRAVQGPSSSATDQRGLIDPANFKGSNGSCEKDDNREPDAAAVAADRLVSSSSAAAYILGAILKISVSCEQQIAHNRFLNDSRFGHHLGFLGSFRGFPRTLSMLFCPYFRNYTEHFSLL